MRLLLLNVAGASPGLGDRATQGTPAKFALCLAEHEEASPWAPFQTTRGFAPEDSTVTVAASEGPHNIQDHGSNTALGVLQTLAGALGQAGSNNILSRGEPAARPRSRARGNHRRRGLDPCGGAGVPPRARPLPRREALAGVPWRR